MSGVFKNSQRFYFDTEFIEDGRTIDLLSIGLVREDGAMYYAEPAETDRSRASEWVQENVLPYLTGPIKPRAQIAAEIANFAGNDPEFWAWYADYDWVALCQLFGTMMDLPSGWPMYARDFKQVVDERDLGKLSEQTAEDGPEHNALSDARWLARVASPILAAQPSVPAPAPADEVEALADLLDEAERDEDGDAWQNRLARRVLDSDWLARHDAEVRREASEKAYDEGWHERGAVDDATPRPSGVHNHHRKAGGHRG